MVTTALLMLLAQAASPGVAIQATDGKTTQTVAQPDEPANDALIDQAATAIKAGRSADALPFLDRVIAAEEAAHGHDTRLVFSARSITEGLAYTALGATAKKDAIVLGPDWAMAVFLKGFALVDVGRGDEAKPMFDRALSLSPMNSQFFAERGEWYKTRKDWNHAESDFAQAADFASFSPDALQSTDKRRGLRGQAFVLSEQGKFDKAEALYRQCLRIDPADANAQHELEWIADQRRQTKRGG